MAVQFDMERLLLEVLTETSPSGSEGQVASYIPELSKSEPTLAGVAVMTPDGLFQAGDSRHPFTLQSISKIITLMVALEKRGMEEVFARLVPSPQVIL